VNSCNSEAIEQSIVGEGGRPAHLKKADVASIAELVDILWR
jgi:hypothetical protein